MRGHRAFARLARVPSSPGLKATPSAASPPLSPPPPRGGMPAHPSRKRACRATRKLASLPSKHERAKPFSRPLREPQGKVEGMLRSFSICLANRSHCAVALFASCGFGLCCCLARLGNRLATRILANLEKLKSGKVEKLKSSASHFSTIQLFHFPTRAKRAGKVVRKRIAPEGIMRELDLALIFAGWSRTWPCLFVLSTEGLNVFVSPVGRFRGRGRCETPKGLMVRRRWRAKAQPLSPTATTRHQAAHLRVSHRSARSW